MSIIRRKLPCLCDTSICHSVWVASGLLVGFKSNPTRKPDATYTDWQILVSHRDSNFPWWWTLECPQHVQKGQVNIFTELCTYLDYLWNSTGNCTTVIYLAPCKMPMSTHQSLESHWSFIYLNFCCSMFLPHAQSIFWPENGTLVNRHASSISYQADPLLRGVAVCGNIRRHAYAVS